MTPDLRQMYEQHAIDEQTISSLQAANADLREALQVATNWLAEDCHPLGWTIDRLRSVAKSA